MLDTIGCADKMVERGLTSSKATMRTKKRVLFEPQFSSLPSTKFPCTVMLPQSGTEQLLLDTLTEHGRVLYRSKKVVSMKDGKESQSKVVEFESGEIVTARYVVGADGKQSTVNSNTSSHYLNLCFTFAQHRSVDSQASDS